MTTTNDDPGGFREAVNYHLQRGAITSSSVDTWRERWLADPVQTKNDMQGLAAFADIAERNSAAVGDQAAHDAAVAQITNDAPRD